MREDRLYVDVSEIKVFRECRRKWAFSSRNKMHLRAIDQKLPLRMGTAFHQALEQMYLGMEPDIDTIGNELDIDVENRKMMTLNLGGYYRNVLQQDLQRFAVVDTEYRFDIPAKEVISKTGYEGTYLHETGYDNLHITGSVDLIYRDRDTGLVGGLEHKYLRNFRPKNYEHLDEQPKLYYYAILNDFGSCEMIGVNQIRKLKTKFDHMRTRMVYTEKQLDNFMKNFLDDCLVLLHSIHLQEFPCTPAYMGCQLCDYAPLCLHMNAHGTDDIELIDNKEFLEAHGFRRRLIDHLEEK